MGASIGTSYPSWRNRSASAISSTRTEACTRSPTVAEPPTKRRRNFLSSTKVPPTSASTPTSKITLSITAMARAATSDWARGLRLNSWDNRVIETPHGQGYVNWTTLNHAGMMLKVNYNAKIIRRRRRCFSDTARPGLVGVRRWRRRWRRRPLLAELALDLLPFVLLLAVDFLLALLADLAVHFGVAHGALIALLGRRRRLLAAVLLVGGGRGCGVAGLAPVGAILLHVAALFHHLFGRFAMRRGDPWRRARELGAGVDLAAINGGLEEVAHQQHGVVAALAPVAAAHGDPVVIETHPGACHQVRVHQDEPAVRVVLGGAGLAGDVAGDAEAGADRRARAPVDDAAHHVDQGDGAGLAHGARRRRRREAGQLLAIAVGDVGDENGLPVFALGRDAGVGIDHLQQGDGTGAQRQRRHRLQLALVDAQRLGQADDGRQAGILHHLGGDGIFREHQAVAHGHGGARGAGHVGGPPGGAVARLDVHDGVAVRVVGGQALFQRGAVHEGFEGRSRLAGGARDVVELVALEIAAADPGAHGAAGRIDGDKTRFQARFDGV